jgi:hypothetical protein
MRTMREAPRGTHDGANDSLTIRMGALALPLGVVVAVAATGIHPHKEDVMDNAAVFTEYAHDTSWIGVHFLQSIGALLLFAGLLGVHYALRTRSGFGTGLVRLGGAAAVQSAAAFMALQAVDGIALKWAVDNWASAGAGQKDAALAAAEALRWTEYAFQSYANVLLGLALAFYGLAIAIFGAYPRWLGWVSMGSAAGWILHGVMVSYVGLFDSAPRLVAMVLLAVWGFAMGFLMWRKAQWLPADPGRTEPAATHAATR